MAPGQEGRAISDTVHANLEDLKRLQRAVDAAEREVNEALKKVQKALDSADWNDARRRDFDSKLKEASSTVKRTTERFVELRQILSREVGILQQYLSRR